ncbi:hypothetical protein MS3_00000603 [Schistosoma haematobium]|uniref:Reverse transcriptase/retrotransposon-derived protein RNase H-like domain-containing protein n=1 Tax=Schistosoma haematobium TaxID=6185 RepID=A0A922LF27_SCHHA|nr:hypothetical protein MS3_00000603 [Schistosoma haematobium]KAH9581395.1 hypothetical protein MS3_00000603 [Schistosoma haematobium]
MKAPILLKPEAEPVFRPKRSVPYAAMFEVYKELGRFPIRVVIMPVSYSAWVAPIVVIKKANGASRICADFFTGLNAALEQYNSPLPNPEDFSTMLRFRAGPC